MKAIFLTLAAVAALTACSDSPQGIGAGKLDVAPYNGTGKTFVAPDWKPGDKASWESRLKARAQYGQNDFTRMN